MRSSLLLVLVLYALVLSFPVKAEIPQILSYQGKVTDTGGTIVPDGSYEMVFRIYNQQTGGSALWNSGTLSVDVAGGMCSVLLGDGNPIDLGFDEDYWLEVEIESDLQSPRLRLGSVGYAYMASGLVPGTLIEGSITSGTSSAIKGVNTASSGTRYGAYFGSASSEGRGVYGWASDPTGTTYGGKFENVSTSGTGVYGKAYAATGTTYGGYFESSSNSGRGVYGEAPTYGVVGKATSETGINCGGHFETDSESGRGVVGVAQATTGATYGGTFESHSVSGTGVAGLAIASSGTTYGVYGLSTSPSGRGIYGRASTTTGTTYGGYFESPSSSGRGVYGEARHIGVEGVTTDATGLHYGGFFESVADQASGIRAFATSTTGIYTTYGVYGRSYASVDGSIGVYGRSSYNTNSGATYGVYGRSDGLETSPSGPYPLGVYGLAGNASSSFGIGGYFQSNASQGCGAEGQSAFVGVRARATGTSGLNHGIAATTSSTAGVAGWFEGDINVTGDIHKSNCYFLIDHPLDPKNKLLRHTCVESPENLLIYRGTVMLNANGEAVVELPGYFEALTDEAQASVHLTPHGKPFLTGFEWQTGYTAFIVYGSPERTVSWMVLAGRDDPVARQHRRPVEEEKGADGSLCNRGKMLYPTAYGYPETTGMKNEIFPPACVYQVEEPGD